MGNLNFAWFMMAVAMKTVKLESFSKITNDLTVKSYFQLGIASSVGMFTIETLRVNGIIIILGNNSESTINIKSATKIINSFI